MEITNLTNGIKDCFKSWPISRTVLSEAIVSNYWRSSFIDVDTDVEALWAALEDSHRTRNLIDLLNDTGTMCKKFNNHVDALPDLPAIAPEHGTPVNNVSRLSGSSSIDSLECENNFWKILLENDCHPRRILAFLFSLIRRGNMANATVFQKQISLISCTVYLLILSIKGSKAFRVYQTGFLHEILKAIESEYTTSNKRKPAAVRRGQKKSARMSQESAGEILPFHSDEDNEENIPNHEQRENLNTNLKNSLIKEILFGFVNTLSRFSMRAYINDLKSVIKVMVFLAVQHVENDKLDTDSASINGLAFKVLEKCANDRFHGFSRVVHLEIMKNLLVSLNEIVAVKGNGHRQSCQLTQINQFIKHLMKTDDENAIEAAVIFYKQLCIRASDKTEAREKTARRGYDLVRDFPFEIFCECLAYTVQISWQPEVNSRLTALDILLLLFLDEDKIARLEDVPELTPLKIIEKVLKRCTDQSSTVVTHSINFISHERVLRFLMHTSLGLSILENGGGTSVLDASHNPNRNLKKQLLKKLMRVAVDLSVNERVHIRKSVLLLLQQLMCLHTGEPKSNFYKLVGEFSLDPSVLVRKQFCQSIHKILLSNPNSNNAQELFIKSLLPLLNDCEVSAQEKCLEQVEDVILKGIVNNQEMAWSVLRKISQGNSQYHKGYVQKALHTWVKNGKIKGPFIKQLEKQTNSENKNVSWMLLAIITNSQDCPNADYKFVLSSWRECKTVLNEQENDVFKNIIETIGNCAGKLPMNAISNMMEYFSRDVSDLTLPLVAIKPTVNALQKMLKASTLTPEEVESSLEKFASNALRRCNGVFEGYFTNNSIQTLDTHEEQVLKVIETYGVLAEIYPRGIEPKTEQYIQSLAVANKNVKVKQIAILCLGTFCLQNSLLAKDSLLLLVKELQESKNKHVIVNVLAVMGDFCIRYSSLVDHYIPVMSNCLGSDVHSVCYETLTILTRLLQEDYLKWKDTLFCRIVYLVSHKDQELARYTKFILIHLLVYRHPKFFAQHFTETILFFNGFERSMKPFPDTQNERFFLKGPGNFNRRMSIYNFMLENSKPEDKYISINSQLVGNLIAKFISKDIALDEVNGGLIKDTLAILCCEEMKPTSYPSNTDDTQTGEVQQQKKNTIAKKMRRIIVEKILGASLPLKHILNQSPLMKDFLNFIKEFTKDFKNEVQDLLAGDPQLAKELAFDLRQLPKDQSDSSSETE